MGLVRGRGVEVGGGKRMDGWEWMYKCMYFQLRVGGKDRVRGIAEGKVREV